MSNDLLDSEMPAEQLRLHMGELTPKEVLVARAAIRWANTRKLPDAGIDVEQLRKDLRVWRSARIGLQTKIIEDAARAYLEMMEKQMTYSAAQAMLHRSEK